MVMKYVFAGNYREFIYWCRCVENVSPRDPSVYYVGAAYHLRGVMFKPTDTLIYYGTYDGRRDRQEIGQALMSRLWHLPDMEWPKEVYN